VADWGDGMSAGCTASAGNGRLYNVLNYHYSSCQSAATSETVIVELCWSPSLTRLIANAETFIVFNICRRTPLSKAADFLLTLTKSNEMCLFLFCFVTIVAISE